MKTTTMAFLTLSALVAVFAASPALASADDAAWIKKCVADNADQKQTPAVVASYCSCMNNKMSSSETLSITAWEKTHKKEADACGAEAGWKGK